MAKPEPKGYAAKVGSRPFIYSEEHSAWRAAFKRGDGSHDEHAARWAKRFGPKPRASTLYNRSARH